MIEQVLWISASEHNVLGGDEFTENDRICYGTPEEKARMEAESVREERTVKAYLTRFISGFSELPTWAKEVLVDNVLEDMEQLEYVEFVMAGKGKSEA